jgi:hypothetical protein
LCRMARGIRQTLDQQPDVLPSRRNRTMTAARQYWPLAIAIGRPRSRHLFASPRGCNLGPLR